MASECGRPIGIDRPALYFPKVDFVLSHTGWPWVDEALAMVGKHANVFLGTAAFPPHHWSPQLLHFISGAGSGKVMLGTSFPVVGHRHALMRLRDVELSEQARAALLDGCARRVFSRLAKEPR
jgi:predicted TIM-barrel fold metal-dependent hydrolase